MPIPTEKYEHHGRVVSVISSVKGKHREHCLCFNGCKKFKPSTTDNCRIAQAIFATCVKHSVVTPVFECPEFEP
jgi:hypothetical protein